MNPVLIALATLSIVCVSHAQDANPSLPKDFKPVKITKTKISCTDDRMEKIPSNSPEHQTIITKGKVSESFRTTWASGDTEYRFSEYTNFQENGEAFSKGRNMAKVVTKKEGQQVTEVTQNRNIVHFVKKDFEVSGGNLQQRDSESTDVYQVNGNERVLLSSVLNGKVMPTNGLREIEIKLNDKQKVLQIIEKTPYTYENGDFKMEVLKSELTCLLEEIE